MYGVTGWRRREATPHEQLLQQHSLLGPAGCRILLRSRAADVTRLLGQVPWRHLVLLRLRVPLLAKPTCAQQDTVLCCQPLFTNLAGTVTYPSRPTNSTLLLPPPELEISPAQPKPARPSAAPTRIACRQHLRVCIDHTPARASAAGPVISDSPGGRPSS